MGRGCLDPYVASTLVCDRAHLIKDGLERCWHFLLFKLSLAAKNCFHPENFYL
jgi:hypothetical protein